MKWIKVTTITGVPSYFSRPDTIVQPANWLSQARITATTTAYYLFTIVLL